MEADAPLGIFEDVVEDEGLAVGAVPFGLEVAEGLGVGELRLRFGPGEVFGFGDDEFEFVGAIVNVADWRFKRFWRQGNPVEGAGVGMGS